MHMEAFACPFYFFIFKNEVKVLGSKEPLHTSIMSAQTSPRIAESDDENMDLEGVHKKRNVEIKDLKENIHSKVR